MVCHMPTINNVLPFLLIQKQKKNKIFDARESIEIHSIKMEKGNFPGNFQDQHEH